MTENKAKELAAAMGDGYRARRCRSGDWCVWSDEADHRVEFDFDEDTLEVVR